MAWQTPKTDWQITDYYNIEDWHRVRNNLEFIWNYLVSKMGYVPPTLLETDTGRERNELPYVRLVNNMEENLRVLQDTFGVDFTEDTDSKTWYARLDALYQANPTYADWNRWEMLLKRVYESIVYINTYAYAVVSGTCHCGSARNVLHFSRGR